MLLPLDLAALAWRHSDLTPELALGWRLGRYAHDWFDGLDRVRIAATGHPHTLAALQRLARFPKPGMVVQPTGFRPWDMLFFHEPTGTALKVVCISKRIRLPLSIRELAEQLDWGDPEITQSYQDELTALVGESVTDDPAIFCRVSEIRCLILDLDETKRPNRCPWCPALEPTRLLEVDGRICCPECAGLEPDWLNA